MYFFEITSNTEAEEFIHWLEYIKHSLPIVFYLNGITYTLANQEWLDCFIIGFKAARQIIYEASCD